MNLGKFVKRCVKAITPYGLIVLYRNSPWSIIKNRLITADAVDQTNDEREYDNVFDKIYKSAVWMGPYSEKSLSGPGSEIKYTKPIRKALPKLWKKYGVKTFLDAPCGDYNWMNAVDKTGIEYIGGDIVGSVIENNIKAYSAPNVTFRKLDITKDDLPKVDMILCKDCLQHLSYENVHKALANFKRSGSKYLLVTSYRLTHKNWDIKDGGYRQLNLCIAPFNLRAPLEIIKEGSSIGGDPDRAEYLFGL